MTGVALLRCARASTLAAVVVLGAVAAHVAGGGATPPLPAVVLMLAGTAVLVAPLLGEPASTARVVALVVGGQALMHVAFQGLTPKMQSMSTMTSGMWSAMPDGTGQMAGQMAGATPANPPSVAMTLGHLVAAVAVGLWLAAGERAAWTILSLTGRPVIEALRVLLHAVARHLVLVVPAPTKAPAVPGAFARLVLRASVWSAPGRPRRGPPCFLCA